AAHSALVEPVLAEFSKFVAGLKLQAPQIPYISNITGTWITPEQAASAQYWVRHLRQTVRFTAGMRTLLETPECTLLEVGPGHTLSTFVRQHPAISPRHAVLPSFGYPQPHEPELASLLATLGRLWLAGVRVDWCGFYTNERRRRL